MLEQDDILKKTSRRSFLWMGGSAAFVLCMGIDKYPTARPTIPRGPKTFHWICNDREDCYGLWSDPKRWSLTPGGIYVEGAGVPGPEDTAILSHAHVVINDPVTVKNLEISNLSLAEQRIVRRFNLWNDDEHLNITGKIS